MGYDGPQANCAKCGAANFTIRKRCRACGNDLGIAETFRAVDATRAKALASLDSVKRPNPPAGGDA